eukprot:6714157-Pyramimonas_sp.AAC.1
MFEDRVSSEHLLALSKESQRGAIWRVASASDYTVPRRGTRPGTVCPADIFNFCFPMDAR